MPFLAENDSGTVVDARDDEVDKSAEYQCPTCGGTLQYRRRASDSEGNTIRRAHFWHTEGLGKDSGVGGCYKGGESERHHEIKRQVVTELRNKYSGDIYVEKKVGGRVADVLIEFDEVYGNRNETPLRTAVEVQVANDSKKYIEVTKNYLRHETAVYWVFDIPNALDQLIDAKRQLTPFMDPPVHLGEVGGTQMSLGRMIYFDNFEYIVTSFDELQECPTFSGRFHYPDPEFGRFELIDEVVEISMEYGKEEITPETVTYNGSWNASIVERSDGDGEEETSQNEVLSRDVLKDIQDGKLKRIEPFPISKY